MPRIFDGVAGNAPSLNRFDLSYTNTLSMSFGYLYPVQCDEVYPGDVFKMSCFCHAELMPLVTPVMSDIQIFAHTFFVPYRIIYGVDNENGMSIWEEFITGGKDGDYDTPLTAWEPDWSSVGFSSKKIWDYIGNPVKRTVTGSGTALDPYVTTWTPIVPSGLDVSIAPKYSYNAIYNAFYRDENLVDEVSEDNEDILKAAFKKDYFTSALESQQRGDAPALPVDVNFGSNFFVNFQTYDAGADFYGVNSYVGSDSTRNQFMNLAPVGATTSTVLGLDYNGAEYGMEYHIPEGATSAVSQRGVRGIISGSALNSIVKATTFTVSDLRLAFAIQRMQELSMRSGYRYTEWLSAHYNAHPTDARLDRPEYIGGCVMNVSISPLMQNSESASTPQGTKVGVGRVDSIQKLGNYRVLEHGLVMTIVSIRPKPIYKQGINRQWLRQVKEDYYIPEMAWLSEQGIYNAELFVGGSSDVDESGNAFDPQIFGYQAHWNEMRCKNNMVSGAVREQFYHWTLARTFATRPALNQDFIEIDDGDFNQIFAVQDEDEFIVSWSNLIDAYRPIPAMGVPGLVDHVYGGRY